MTVNPQSRTTSVWAPSPAATLIGTLATSPPSTRVRPLRSTDGKTSGMAALANNALTRSSLSRLTARPVVKSVAIAVSGSCRSAKSRAVIARSMNPRSPSLDTAAGRPAARLTACFTNVPKISCRVTVDHSSVRRSGAAAGSSATTAPLSEPTEVPTTRSG